MRILFSIILLVSYFTLYSQESNSEFKPSGKITTQVFGDYYYVIRADTGIASLSKTASTALNKPRDMNGFRFRRANIGYEYTGAPNITAMIRIEADEVSLASDGKTSFYLKDAYIKWGIIRNSYLYIGLQPTFAYDVNERMLGLRYIEKPLLDLRGVVSSRDLGVSLRGTFLDGGKLNYNIMFANNSSTKPAVNKDKRIYGNLDYKPTSDIDLVIYGDYLFKPYVNGVSHNEYLAGFFAGIKKEKLAAGVEGFYKMVHNGYKTSAGNPDHMPGLMASAFVNGKFSSIFGYLARFDYYDPNTKIKGDRRNFLIAGLTYYPIPAVILSPNLMLETYEKTTKYSPVPSIWARLTFQWIFK
jgi:hypothetical protein